MSNFTTVSDGVVVTNNGIPPPRNWSNSYEVMGGDEHWGPGCYVEREVRKRGIEGVIKPHYGTPSNTGETVYLLEIVGGSFFFFNAINRSLMGISHPEDLKSIVDVLDKQGIHGIEYDDA